MALGPTQPPIQLVWWAVSSGVKRPGCEADHSPPSSAEVKNAWSYLPTPQYVFMEWCLVKHRDNFTFYLMIIHGKWSHAVLPCSCRIFVAPFTHRYMRGASHRVGGVVQWMQVFNLDRDVRIPLVAWRSDLTIYSLITLWITSALLLCFRHLSQRNVGAAQKRAIVRPAQG
jgi:hypothetical protein